MLIELGEAHPNREGWGLIVKEDGSINYDMTLVIIRSCRHTQWHKKKKKKTFNRNKHLNT